MLMKVTHFWLLYIPVFWVIETFQFYFKLHLESTNLQSFARAKTIQIGLRKITKSSETWFVQPFLCIFFIQGQIMYFKILVGILKLYISQVLMSQVGILKA